MQQAANNPLTKDIKKIIEEEVKKLVPQILKSNAFTDRKLTDLPTDALQVVNRKYVTLNGTSAQRPTGSILGQFYFDTTINRPIWWDGTKFINAAGTTV